MSSPTKVTPISGFPEFLPAERLVELHFLDTVRERGGVCLSAGELAAKVEAGSA